MSSVGGVQSDARQRVPSAVGVGTGRRGRGGGRMSCNQSVYVSEVIVSASFKRESESALEKQVNYFTGSEILKCKKIPVLPMNGSA